jgi:signal transduction histidine kinase
MAKNDRFLELVLRACFDLSSPLAAVHGFARVLNSADDLDEDVRRYLAMIEEASTEMRVLIDQLAVAARIERGGWQPRLRELNTVRLARSRDERIQVEDGPSCSNDQYELKFVLQIRNVTASGGGGFRLCHA